MLQCHLFPTMSTHSFKESRPVAELTRVAATKRPPRCCALSCIRVPVHVPPGHVRPWPRQVARH